MTKTNDTMPRFLTAATLVTAVRALAFDGKPARETKAVIPDATFNLPEITAAPAIKELFKRQSSGDQTVLIGPDNTCGYVSGRAGRFISFPVKPSVLTPKVPPSPAMIIIPVLSLSRKISAVPAAARETIAVFGQPVWTTRRFTIAALVMMDVSRIRLH